VSTYDLYGQTGTALIALLIICLAIPVAWSAVHVTRWAISLLHDWVLASIVMPSTYDQPPSQADARDWIDEWHQARTPEATAERVAARVRGEHR